MSNKKDPEIEAIKRDIRIIIAGLQNAMEDDFEKYYNSDIDNAIKDLEELRESTE